MTLTISPPPSATPRAPRPEAGATSRVESADVRRKTRAASRTGSAGLRPKIGASARLERGPGRNDLGLLGRYLNPEGRLRQVVALPAAAGSVLVVDRDAITLGDRHLVAHLAADEPPENAALVCDRYLGDPGSRRCRRVTPQDLEVVPFAEAEEVEPQAVVAPSATTLTDRHGRTYRLELRSAGMSIPELRWCRGPSAAKGGSSEPISMREAIAGLERYEPVRTLTNRALTLHRADPAVSIATLRAERARMDVSQIVLNRGLRRAALAATAVQGLSMSEIAIRCGQVRHDSKGNASGETSWLARRLGIAPEGGESTPTPWIHSDVLALIARCGLGISPREVELG